MQQYDCGAVQLCPAAAGSHIAWVHYRRVKLWEGSLPGYVPRNPYRCCCCDQCRRGRLGAHEHGNTRPLHHCSTVPWVGFTLQHGGRRSEAWHSGGAILGVDAMAHHGVLLALCTVSPLSHRIPGGGHLALRHRATLLSWAVCNTPPGKHTFGC